jgi:hypothetical protein
MELDKIDEFLKKYFDGETSIQEENALKSYFQSHKVAPQHQEYKDLFNYLDEAKQYKSTSKTELKSRNNAYKWMSVAALVLIMLSVGTVFYKNYNKSVHEINTGTGIDDPKIAFEETKKALDLVSEKLIKGLASMEYINEFEKSKNLIFK